MPLLTREACYEHAQHEPQPVFVTHLHQKIQFQINDCLRLRCIALQDEREASTLLAIEGRIETCSNGLMEFM